MDYSGFGRSSGPKPHARSGISFGNPPPNPSPPIPGLSSQFGAVQTPSRPQQQRQTSSQFSVAQTPNRPHEQFQQRQQHISPQGERLVSPLPVQANQSSSLVTLGYAASGEKLSPRAANASMNQASTELRTNSLNYNVNKRVKSPPLPSQNFDNKDNYHSPSVVDYRRPNLSPPRFPNQGRSSFNSSNSPPQQRSHLVDYSDIHDGGIVSTPKNTYANAPKRGRSPSASGVALRSYPAQLNAERQNVSPSRLANQRSPVNYANSPSEQRLHLVDYSDKNDGESLSPAKIPNASTPKRARSPPPAVARSSFSMELDTEREVEAKAKRLARFKVELSAPTVNLNDLAKRNLSHNKHTQSFSDKWDADGPADEARDLESRDNSVSVDGSKSFVSVVGLCPDMCPESEREERERKGDLDKYERFDGDRNQTSKSLAVKKYNRTALREPELIRPMPVLQKTLDYLLSLLDQPYGDNFLGLYNFLWDRMRAIRMDLRMQHIFNQQAIIMLEQMIRLHIVAMHELCEYDKGEGFSEGFDAHLNIEQMNKTSVELFQIYDDHRKKGISVATEKEFRGYYALLKLDKHPGYKVEPSELSLDLAKMPPEIRCTPEVLFARDVARACRIGNYIAFFRLARKATYLQACLMHAHFAKLRTQSLASLHSGLQYNRGIPVTHVVNWLGMEEEDVESLLEYHGFVLKRYEEIYMVKEGPFLNGDLDFPSKRALLVDLKKSPRIIDDIYFGSSIPDMAEDEEFELDAVDDVDLKPDELRAEIERKPMNEATDDYKTDGVSYADSVVQSKKLLEVPPSPFLKNWAKAGNEARLDYEADSTLRANFTKSKKLLDVPSLALNKETDKNITEVFHPGAASGYVADSVSDHEQQYEDKEVIDPERNTHADQTILLISKVNNLQDFSPRDPQCNKFENSTPQKSGSNTLNDEVQMLEYPKKNEITAKKLKLILRKWKQRASRQKEIREQKMLLANEALSSLSLGPPVRKIEMPPRLVNNKLNIDYAVRKRYGRQGKSWSALNVSELVGPILNRRNPDARCLCWKLLVFVQATGKEGQTYCTASKWLLSKLLGSGKEKGLMVSNPQFSIWKKWSSTLPRPFQTCCLSVIKEIILCDNEQVSGDDILGTTSIIFLVSEDIPWDVQRLRLQNLLVNIPSGLSLPLVILSGDVYKKEDIDPSATIISRLGLHNCDETKVKSSSVIFLCGNCGQDYQVGFFNDDKLRDSLQWLANHSPLQPTVRLVRTHEVVLSYLRLLQEVEYYDSSEVGPSYCITTFNEALEKLVEDILTAASMNPNHWPGPEIELLEKSSDERIVADMFLPSIGWSSHIKIEPVISAIRGCKLPEFSLDISWLSQGSHLGSNIINQKLALEQCLISYLTQSCRLLNDDLAAREASTMVQTSVDLELRGSFYFIKPRWLQIFRRIQNWRLMSLTVGQCSVAYLLEQHLERSSALDFGPTITSYSPLNSYTGLPNLENSLSLGYQPYHSVSNKLSFGEIVETCCKVPPSELASSPSAPVFSAHGTCEVGNGFNTDNSVQDNEDDFNHSQTDTKQNVPKMDERLNILLKQCKKLQDRIDDTLSIFF